MIWVPEKGENLTKGFCWFQISKFLTRHKSRFAIPSQSARLGIHNPPLSWDFVVPPHRLYVFPWNPQAVLGVGMSSPALLKVLCLLLLIPFESRQSFRAAASLPNRQITYFHPRVKVAPFTIYSQPIDSMHLNHIRVITTQEFERKQRTFG